MHTFLSTSISTENVNILNSLANISLIPYQTLFGERKVKLLGNSNYSLDVTIPSAFKNPKNIPNYICIALAIIFLIPSILFGTVMRLSSYLFTNISIKSLDPKLKSVWDSFRNIQGSRDKWMKYLEENTDKKELIWQDPEFIKKFDEYMVSASKNMDLFFSEAKRHTASDDPADLIPILNDYNKPFLATFAFCNFVGDYRFARAQSYLKKRNNEYCYTSTNNKYFWHIPKTPNSENTDAFFKENTPQARWREKYNKISAQMSEIQAAAKTKKPECKCKTASPYPFDELDNRIRNWTKADKDPKSNFLAVPDQLPGTCVMFEPCAE